MKLWVGVTDNEWFSNLAVRNFDEINSRQPSARPPSVNAPVGMPFLFKLETPNHDIAGECKQIAVKAIDDELLVVKELA
jgi:putative restriction endonuclease